MQEESLGFLFRLLIFEARKRLHKTPQKKASVSKGEVLSGGRKQTEYSQSVEVEN